MSGIIIDSSVRKNIGSHSLTKSKDLSIRVGMVRQELYDPESKQTKYIVEVFDKTNQVPISCVRLDRFGGTYNFEEYTHNINISDSKNLNSGSTYSVRPGDVVLVACAGGDSREGFILGGIKHPARDENTSLKNSGSSYRCDFNGVQTSINSSGEYSLTFRGIPTNLPDIIKPSTGNTVPAPQYDDTVGTSFLKFDKTGSWTLSDNSKTKVQSILVDKPSGKIVVTSGDVVLTMDKNAQLTSLVTKDLKIDASNSIVQNTKTWYTTATTSTSIKTPKVAIGTDSIELLAQLVALVDALAKVVIYAPEGPCCPFGVGHFWPEVEKIKQNINTIRGSL